MVYLTGATYKGEYRILIKFSSGEEMLIDLKDSLDGEVFSPLKDQKRFSQFVIHPDLETLTWDNGADFAPEYLLDLGRKQMKQPA